MTKVRMHKPAEASGSNATQPPVKSEPNPLRISGVVVEKAALIEALRVYVPALVDIRVTEDGEHFWLVLSPERNTDGE